MSAIRTFICPETLLKIITIIKVRLYCVKIASWCVSEIKLLLEKLLTRYRYLYLFHWIYKKCFWLALRDLVLRKRYWLSWFRAESRIELNAGLWILRCLSEYSYRALLHWFYTLPPWSWYIKYWRRWHFIFQNMGQVGKRWGLSLEKDWNIRGYYFGNTRYHHSLGNLWFKK